MARGRTHGALAPVASKWSTQEWIHFLSSLPRRLDAPQLTALDRQFT